MTTADKTLCIVGASGLVGSNIVKAALDRGYTVRGTLRDKDAPDKAPYLMALPGAAERLTLLSADMANEEDFDAPLTGADADRRARRRTPRRPNLRHSYRYRADREQDQYGCAFPRALPLRVSAAPPTHEDRRA